MAAEEKQQRMPTSAEARMAELERISEYAEKNDTNLAIQQGLVINTDEVLEEMNSKVEDVEEKEEVKPQAKAKVIAKIDGVEEEVEIEYLTNQYQKLRYAEEQMKKAAQERKELELMKREFDIQRAQTLDKREQDLKELEQGHKQTISVEAVNNVHSVKDAISTLMLGDEAAAVKSLDEAINARVNAEIERRQKDLSTKLKAETDAHMNAKFYQQAEVNRWNNLISQAQSKNPEIFQDEDLASLWEAKVRTAHASGLSPELAVDQVTDHLAKKFGKAEQKEEGFKVNEAELREKEAKKADTKRFQVEGKAVQASKKQHEEEESPSDIIKQMQAYRERLKQGYGRQTK